MKAWKPPNEERFRDAYLNGATNDDLVLLAGSTLNKVLKYIKRAQESGALPRRLKQYNTSPDAVKNFNNAWNLKGNRLICSDIHAPFHSERWIERLLRTKDKAKIGTLTIVGDGLDMHAFSAWGGDPELPWKHEALIAGELVWRLYSEFNRIEWIRGNHCDRISRKTDWQMDYSHPLDAILCGYARQTGEKYEPGRIDYTEYPYAWLDDEWMLVHPRSYSRIPTNVSRQLALKYQKHVMAGHGHLCGQSVALDGVHVAIDTGGLMDMDKVSYQHMSITTHPRWNNGFVVYKDGCADLKQESPLTNWRGIDKAA